MKSIWDDLYNLNGQTAFVTGACGIIGQKFCSGLAELGANIAVVDINVDAANKLASALEEKYKIKAKGFVCDVSDKNSVQNCVNQVKAQFHSIDILLNNAASKSENLDAFFASFESYSLEEWRKVMSVNLDGMFLVAQAVGDIMTKQKNGGRMILTSSIYGIVGPDQSIYEGSFYLDRQINLPAVYSASKAGIVGLTKYLATYWAKQNIRVNCIVPGGVESGQNQIFQQKYGARVPLGRMASASEMVGPMLFLASEASSYVTGQIVPVDGGLTSW